MSRLSRRGFLKNTVGAALVAALASIVKPEKMKATQPEVWQGKDFRIKFFDIELESVPFEGLWEAPKQDFE